ncbi:hypothetical protein PTRA_b0306 [Pseudoalteromonas translucida KMM 520]|uniref:Uncharacterized protein n=1 Tax=Pseudoalteromonas translucida KMM 520 TaxID=1315283 RepID=A0A0U2WSG8_9GAMM|nr:hypothetical protein PTRA_b0306 [Pseudoalteromonas translucida KMM 520]
MVTTGEVNELKNNITLTVYCMQYVIVKNMVLVCLRCY